MLQGGLRFLRTPEIQAIVDGKSERARDQRQERDVFGAVADSRLARDPEGAEPAVGRRKRHAKDGADQLRIYTGVAQSVLQAREPAIRTEVADVERLLFVPDIPVGELIHRKGFEPFRSFAGGDPLDLPAD